METLPAAQIPSRAAGFTGESRTEAGRTSPRPHEWDTHGAVSQENLEIVKRAIDAFSRGDAAAFAALTTSDLEWISGLGTVEGEIFRGHKGVGAYFSRLNSVLGEFEFIADEFCDLVDGVLVLGRLEGRGRDSEDPVYSPVGIIWDLRGGLIWRLRTYLNHAEALKVVGLAD